MSGEKVFLVVISSFVLIFLFIHSIILIDFSLKSYQISDTSVFEQSASLHHQSSLATNDETESKHKQIKKIQQQSENFNINLFLSDPLTQEQIRRLFDFYSNFTGNSEIANKILKTCLQTDTPVNLAFSLAWAESRFNPTAFNVNRNGSVDRGIFQLNDSYRQDWSINSFYNIDKNIEEGVQYLKKCISDTNGDVEKALGAYNAGLHASMNDALSNKTRLYIRSIIAKEAELNEQLTNTLFAYDSSK
ncbi:transglycosylase SLT domain-containing protein [Desulfamplus magnetovallimortis]|nr:transglycosylase SLT domain-containing protein [Desulfamplus magnetovallimortis]